MAQLPPLPISLSHSSYPAKPLIFRGRGQQCQMQRAVAVPVQCVEVMTALGPGRIQAAARVWTVFDHRVSKGSPLVIYCIAIETCQLASGFIYVKLLEATLCWIFTKKNMENYRFWWVQHLFLWVISVFPIAMYCNENFQRLFGAISTWAIIKCLIFARFETRPRLLVCNWAGRWLSSVRRPGIAIPCLECVAYVV